MNAPLLNPIRFFDTQPDYQDIWPNIDNAPQRINNIDGIWAASYYKEWLYGKDLVLQFETIEGDTTGLKIYKYNEITEIYDLDNTINPVIITPTGWQGNNFLKYTLTLAVGTYYLQFPDGYTSDTFVVTDDIQQRKRFIKIDYSNSQNDYGVIFDNFVFTQYLSGQLLINPPKKESSVLESDRGNITKLRDTPVRMASLHINDIHYTLVDHITMIFACDQLAVNGITYQTTEPPTIEPIEGSDLVNIVVSLSQTNNNYYYAKAS
jgi:hypothetical protein